jgi:cell division protein ZipA
MQANWSLVLNVIFLSVILVMIFSRMRPIFRKKTELASCPLETSSQDNQDDILGLRQIQAESLIFESEDQDVPSLEDGPSLGINFEEAPVKEKVSNTLMLFLVAQGAGVFAGYELLQTLLTCGLRFGEGGLFHRHQHASGQGPILFSLAAATPSGIFDLQNMGAMTMKGLCIFMELSGSSSIDQERYDLFIHTAKQLAEELGANLLDAKQQALTSQTLASMQSLINQEEIFV